MRNGQLPSLNIEDLRVDYHEQLVHIMGKALKERWVPLNQPALAAVRLRLRSRGNPKSEPLFRTQASRRCNVRQLAGEIVKMAPGFDEGIGVNRYKLRHTFATWLARPASNVWLGQKTLNHEGVNTTFRYCAYTGHYELPRATVSLRGNPKETGA